MMPSQDKVKRQVWNECLFPWFLWFLIFFPAHGCGPAGPAATGPNCSSMSINKIQFRQTLSFSMPLSYSKHSFELRAIFGKARHFINRWSKLLSMLMEAHPPGQHKYGTTSKLNFHLWNANSQSFARAKSEAKMAAHGDQFWTSVSVFLAVLYVSSSPLQDFNFQLLFFFEFENIHNRGKSAQTKYYWTSFTYSSV